MADDDLKSTFSLLDKSGTFHEHISSESAAIFAKMANRANTISEIPDLSKKKRPIALESSSVIANTVVGSSSSPFRKPRSPAVLRTDADSFYNPAPPSANVPSTMMNVEDPNMARPVGRNMSFFKRLVSEQQPMHVQEVPMDDAVFDRVSMADMKINSGGDIAMDNGIVGGGGGGGGGGGDNFSELTSVSRRKRNQKRKEEREFFEKKEYLLDLDKWNRLGFKVEQFTMDDPLIKIQYEWERHTLMIQSLERVDTIKMWIRASVLVIYGISRIFTNKLDGWMVSVNNEIENPRYIPAFEEIYREQYQRYPPNPKMQLLYMLLSTAALTVVANLTSTDKQTIGNYGRHAITVQSSTQNASQQVGQASGQQAAPGTNNMQNSGMGIDKLLGGLGNAMGSGGLFTTMASIATRVLPAMLGSGSGGGNGGGGDLLNSIGKMMSGMGGMPMASSNPPPRTPIIPPPS